MARPVMLIVVSLGVFSCGETKKAGLKGDGEQHFSAWQIVCDHNGHYNYTTGDGKIWELGDFRSLHEAQQIRDIHRKSSMPLSNDRRAYLEKVREENSKRKFTSCEEPTPTPMTTLND